MALVEGDDTSEIENLVDSLSTRGSAIDKKFPFNKGWSINNVFELGADSKEKPNLILRMRSTLATSMALPEEAWLSVPKQQESHVNRAIDNAERKAKEETL